MDSPAIEINRAPVLTLWGAVVAERLGFDRDAALTLGKVLAGLNAQAKGRRLGIFRARTASEAMKRPRGEEFWVELCGKPLPARQTAAGVRAVVGDKSIDPQSVQKYLESKFGSSLPAARSALAALANSYERESLNEAAFSLYEKFRPKIPAGAAGWGAKGKLDLERIRSLSRDQ